MHVVGFCGASGAGKTTLITGVVAALKAQGARVSVIKHTHKAFEIDHAGKDSFRHREAGAFEVLIASRERLARIVTFDVPTDLTVHQLIAEAVDCDWLLFEGFRHADLPKVEVWRSALGAPPLYPDDPFVVALATDAPAALPVATVRPMFALDDVSGVTAFLQREAGRFVYHPERHG